MAIADRVREQVSSFSGTGAVPLTTVPVTGFQSFLSGWGASGSGDYLLVQGAQWEVAAGSINAGGTSLVRTAGNVTAGSSGAGVLVNFTGGAIDCMGNFPAAKLTALLRTVKKQVFTSSGTYTPSAGMIYCQIECQGGGGGGGGIAGNVSYLGGGAGGGAGGYSRLLATAATVGASKAVTIGAGGAGGTGNVFGSAGGTTSVGSLCVANGGSGGGGSAGTNSNPTGSQGGVAGTGDIAAPGGSGLNGAGFNNTTSGNAPGGNGANSVFGSGGIGAMTGPGVANGNNASGYGAGGSGAIGYGTASNATGGAGAPGIVIITEFCDR